MYIQSIDTETHHQVGRRGSWIWKKEATESLSSSIIHISEALIANISYHYEAFPEVLPLLL